MGRAPSDRAETPRNRTAGALRTEGRSVEEEIVVTGSRVRRKELTGRGADSRRTREEQIRPPDEVNVGEFLQTIPEQGERHGRATNNGGSGSIRVSLRGIGPQATLVLLNGRRVVPAGRAPTTLVDLNAIPIDVIERIEILKDGASAIYGSDAVAGVVNIITRKRLDGGDISVLGGTSADSTATPST